MIIKNVNCHTKNGYKTMEKINDICLYTNDISVYYENQAVIKDISINLKKGEIISLLGVSGVGKTTLFHAISGLIIPDSGNVMFYDEDITGKAGKISYMLQKDLLLPYKTIIDNVSLPLIIKGMKKKEARKKANQYFDEFGLENTQKKYPHQLSGGMRQRAAFLRTYLTQSKAVLLDEPFSALDTMTKHNMHKWFINIAKEIKLSGIFITHDIDEAIVLSDRIYIMSGQPGRISKELEIKDKNMYNSIDDFLVSNNFLNYKKQILESLN